MINRREFALTAGAGLLAALAPNGAAASLGLHFRWVEGLSPAKPYLGLFDGDKWVGSITHFNFEGHPKFFAWGYDHFGAVPRGGRAQTEEGAKQAVLAEARGETYTPLRRLGWEDVKRQFASGKLAA